MKVEIRNLGVIEKAEIDLKPLTVFIGHNGTGKTWTAYTLASILGKHGFEKYLEAYSDDKTEVKYDLLDHGIQEFLDTGNFQINLIQFAEKYAEKYINDVAYNASSWLSNFLDTTRVDFNNLEVKFYLQELTGEFYEKIRKYSLNRKKTFGSYLSLEIVKQVDEENIYFYRVSEDDNQKISNFLYKTIKNLFSETLFGILHQCLYSYIYIFPTERTTYIGFPFFIQKKVSVDKIEKIIEEIQKDDNFNKAKDHKDGKLEKTSSKNKKHEIFSQIIELLNLLEEDGVEKEGMKSVNRQKKEIGKSAVVESLIEIIANASIKTDGKRQEEIEKNPRISEYVELADFLEENILYGNVQVDSSTLQNEIIFKPSNNINLEVQIASSMVKELAPLSLCLRYLVEPDELLIIDEPEMNLHPAAQVEITEFLAMLVQAGLKVLITTHSPYIVNHLANLMKAAKYEDKESIRKRFYLERTEAFIPHEKVSVYLFEKGTAKNILDEEGRIDWGTFGDVSDDISHIFS